MGFLDKLWDFFQTTGFYQMFANFTDGGWKNLVMIAVSLLLLYLAIKKQF